MKIRKLFHLVVLLALVACAPSIAPLTPTAPAIGQTVADGLAPTASPIPVVALPPTSGPPSPTSPPTSTATMAAPPTIAGPQWGHQVKTAACIIQGPFPDPACTPGDIFPGVTASQVCVSGYSSSVRNVPASEKDAVYAEYGITSHATGQYEVDHFVSLELGGSNDLSNLWPEPASPTPGFHQKDTVENYLHAQVCSGAMTLAQAQLIISTNWLAVYTEMAGGSAPPTATLARTRLTVPPGGEPPTATQAQQAAPTDTLVPPAPADTETQPAAARVRTGALCNDGTSSGATGSGACSKHGGVNCWNYSDGTCTKP